MSKLTRFRRAAKTARLVERVIGWAGIKDDTETWKDVVKEAWPRAVEVLVTAGLGAWRWAMGDPWATFFLATAGVLLVVRVGVPLAGFMRRRRREPPDDSSPASHEENEKRFDDHRIMTFAEMVEAARKSSAVRFCLPYSDEEAKKDVDRIVANLQARDELARNLCDRFMDEHPESCKRVGPIREEEPSYRYVPATVIAIAGDFMRFLSEESAEELTKRRGEGRSG